MVASVRASSPLTMEERFNLEWEYQAALARSKKNCSDTSELCGINKNYNERKKSVYDSMTLLEQWSGVNGTKSTAALKMLTPEFIKKHPKLDNNRVLKDRMNRGEEKNASEAKGKETSDKRPYGKLSISSTRI
ncbi:hypothetical protein BOTNAR_0535g00100 [Botryotinia narcissicola]|uniref:Uncharacterized protein n=1 Tax=Botryotinia narcissicola TaxID=278944 RepID=A0A4Z1HDJ0_9HELO|nr:hypothetical protein BOTNAR_0535g00100 [Botryotinia narcissicola]